MLFRSDTERTYLRGLEVLVNLYIVPLNQRIEKKKAILTKEQIATVFSNIGNAHTHTHTPRRSRDSNVTHSLTWWLQRC